MRSIAEALGGHCRTLRRTAVGPFRVEEADTDRLLPVAEASAAPADAVERVPEAIRAACSSSSRAGRCAVKVARSPASSSAATGDRDRDVRRRPPRPPVGDRHRDRGGPAADGRHLPSAPARGARQPGLAARDARAPPRAAGRRGRGGRRSWSSSRPRSRPRAGAVRRVVPRRDRSRGRRRGRGLPLRPRPQRRPVDPRAPRDPDASRAARRRRLLDPDPPARRRGRGRARPRRCSAGPVEVEGTVVVGRVARRHARLPDREPAHRPEPARPRLRHLRGAASTTAPRSRSASTPTTAAPSAASRPSCSTSRATSTAGGSWSSSGSACATRRPSRAKPSSIAQIDRDVEATRAATRPSI